MSHTHIVSAETRDIPDDWQPDCQNCEWFLERYERADCYLFVSIFDGGWHVLNKYGTKEKLG